MTILVYHEPVKKYAKELSGELGLPSVAFEDYVSNGVYSREEVVFLNGNGDKHHRDLINLDALKRKKALSGEGVRVGLFDAHTDILASEPSKLGKPVIVNREVPSSIPLKKSSGQVREDLGLAEFVSYADWAAYGLAANEFSELDIVGSVNGVSANCPRGHHGAHFICAFPEASFAEKVRIYPSGPLYQSDVSIYRDCPAEKLISFEKALNPSFLSEGNPSVRRARFENGLLSILWKGTDEFEPKPNGKLAFGSIDLDVLDRGIIDSDWSPRGTLSLENLRNLANKFGNIGDGKSYSITGLKEFVQPDKQSAKNLAGLVGGLL